MEAFICVYTYMIFKYSKVCREKFRTAVNARAKKIFLHATSGMRAVG
jgi:hypothetical protein